MKKLSAIVAGVFLLILQTGLVFAQGDLTTEVIVPKRLSVSFSKTTNLIFPYAIKSVDRGTSDVLVQKAEGVENILQVKAARPDFKETNLTVVTSDGSFYSYLLNFTDKSVPLNLQVVKSDAVPNPVAVFTTDATTDLIEQRAEILSTRKCMLRGNDDQNNDVSLSLGGMYIADDVLYLQFRLRNTSSINYDVATLRFYIKDRKKSKRTASQEIQVQPLYTYGNAEVVRHHSEQLVVVAIPKLTIPDKKYMGVEMMELSGGRHLRIKISNRDIVKAKPVN